MRHHAAAVARFPSTLTLALCVVTLTVPAAARAQIEAPPPEELPDAADVVIPDRDLRISSKGLGQMRLGCLGDDGDLCLGTLTVSLAHAVEIPRPEPKDPGLDANGKPKPKPKPKPPIVVQPFTVKTFSFGIVDQGVNTYRFKIPTRAQTLLRKVGKFQVQFSADFAGKNGVRAVETRIVNMYLPLKAPELPPASLLR
jgi:hypothetical protein